MVEIPAQGGWGGEGALDFQVMGMIEWGQNSRPKQIHGPKINPQKICTFFAHRPITNYAKTNKTKQLLAVFNLGSLHSVCRHIMA